MRAQLLFLNGEPEDRLQVDCGAVFKPLEIWTYRRAIGPDGKPLDRHAGRLHPAAQGEPYQLWLPSDPKRALYTPQMEYWLQQWEELRGTDPRRALRPAELQGGGEGRRGHRRARADRRVLGRRRAGPAQGHLLLPGAAQGARRAGPARPRTTELAGAAAGR